MKKNLFLTLAALLIGGCQNIPHQTQNDTHPPELVGAWKLIRYQHLGNNVLPEHEIIQIFNADGSVASARPTSSRLSLHWEVKYKKGNTGTIYWLAGEYPSDIWYELDASDPSHPKLTTQNGTFSSVYVRTQMPPKIFTAPHHPPK